MTRHRVLIDIEFTVDDDAFKVAQLEDDASGVSDVSDAGVRDAVSEGVVQTNWIGHGLLPLRSVVTSRELSVGGSYVGIYLPADPGVNSS